MVLWWCDDGGCLKCLVKIKTKAIVMYLVKPLNVNGLLQWVTWNSE